MGGGGIGGAGGDGVGGDGVGRCGSAGVSGDDQSPSFSNCGRRREGIACGGGTPGGARVNAGGGGGA